MSYSDGARAQKRVFAKTGQWVDESTAVWKCRSWDNRDRTPYDSKPGTTAQRRYYALTKVWADNDRLAVALLLNLGIHAEPETKTVTAQGSVGNAWIAYHHNDKERDADKFTEVSPCNKYWRTKVTTKEK